MAVTELKIPRWMWVLALVTATMPFWNLGHPLWEVDDARYAEVPRETVELHDWVTPHLNYMDYVEKPPLIYWLGALSYSTFGVSEAAAHLPLALLAILGLCAAAWLGSWMFSPKTGVTAAILLGTCAEYSLLSHLQTPDMAVTVFLLWTVALIWRGLCFPRDGIWAYPAAGAAMGLAFLSKGLIGLVFPAGWLVLVFIFVPKIRRSISLQLFLTSIPVCLLIALPWVWSMAHRHPNFLRYFFLEQHFQRFLTKQFDRNGAWYYYIGVDPAGLLPWTPLAIAASVHPLMNWKNTDAGVKQLWLWSALLFLFFSKSNSKLPTYILPILPQQCLLAAEFLRRLPAKPAAERGIKGVSITLAACFWAAIPAGAWAYHARLLPSVVSANLLGTGAALLFVLGAILMISAFKRRFQNREDILPRAVPPAFAMTALLLLGAGQAQPFLSAKEISREIASRLQPGDRIVAYDAYLHGIAFYLKRPVDILVNWRGELRYDEHDPRFQDRFGDEDILKTLPTAGKTTFVVMPNRIVGHFVTLMPHDSIRDMKAFGNFVLATL